MVSLIPIEQIKKRSFIDNNVDDKTVKNSLKIAQEVYLERVLGTDLYDKLIAGVAGGSLELNYQNLLVQKIWPVLIYATEWVAFKKILFRITNSAVVSDSNANSTAISIENLRELISEDEEYFNHHVNKLQLYLQKNVSLFPEYTTLAADGVASTSGQSARLFYSGDDEVYYYGPSSRP